jgi:hypothetical protein
MRSWGGQVGVTGPASGAGTVAVYFGTSKLRNASELQSA